MSLQTFDLATLLLLIAVPLLISQVPILYLRPALIAIITDLCGHPMRAEFWVRSAALLAALGSLLLALMFGTESIRGLITMSLLGSFAAVAFIAHAIWNTVPQDTTLKTINLS
ncbi:MAG TPA: hypothetical protein VL381_01465 [Rhodocyclaceae bacterium]|nr:hypothetical protein [Rhodocyclaceae bacterium]